MLVGGDLNQTQFRPIRVFRNELGVERNRLGRRDRPAKVDKLSVVNDVFVLHDSRGLTRIRSKKLRQILPAVRGRCQTAEKE